MIKRLILSIIMLLALQTEAKVSQLTFTISEKNYVLLVDSSKSMEEFDPNALRESAVRMFSILLPDDSFAGAYQFSSQIETLVPFGKVTSEFRELLSKNSRNVHAYGVLTDLNKALNVASDDLITRPGDKHIVLITDGFIESGIDDAKTDMMIKDLYQNVIPKLAENSIHVHVISSQNAKNKKVLTDLVTKTSGISQEVKYSDELTQKLVYLFDRTGYQAYQLNAKPTYFDVTDRAKEVAIIINDADAKVFLVDPERNEYSQNEYPAYIKWKKDYGYQSIIVKLPIAGRWYIKSDRELDNRVVVFDDFKIEVSDIPHHLFLREHVLINVALMMQGEVVHTQNLVKYLKFKVVDKINGQVKRTFELSSHKKNGIFQGDIMFDEPGQHELTIYVESPAFKRSVSQVLHVYSAPVRFEERRDFKNKKHIIQVYPFSKLLVPNKTEVDAIIKTSKENTVKKLTFDSGLGCWQLILGELPAGEAYSIYFRVEGTDDVGRPFNVLTQSYLVYSELAQRVDIDKIPPSQLPKHLPLIYQFDLINYDYLKELGYPHIKFALDQSKAAKLNKNKPAKAKPFIKYEKIVIKNPVVDLFISTLTMIFLIILLFLYIRNKNVVKKRLYADMYSLLTPRTEEQQ